MMVGKQVRDRPVARAAVAAVMVILMAVSPGCGARPSASTAPGAAAKATVTIVCPGAAGNPAVHVAADDLAKALGRLYPDHAVAVRAKAGGSTDGPIVYVGTVKTLARSPGIESASKRLSGAESYVVTTTEVNGRTAGLIVGADRRGMLYGVYGLLRRLGWGYLLDGDLAPAPSGRPFSFAGWDLADRPLVGRRLVLNWHNFLSGCSSWNLEHWRRWTAQTQKMGYNAIMVHAYGNNPMAGFSFEGLDKPVGYLSTTRLGRDWATMHVNDVRRLIGGEVFDGPVFGSTAAIHGNDRRRTEAAQHMMAEVFAHAERRGVDVIFALDMDTASANPQPLIGRLPESARFKIASKGLAHMLGHTGAFWLVRPDTAAGYRFYKAQLAHLLSVYPQIDTFVLWFRTQSTALMGLKVEDLPADWQAEYKAIIAKEPAVAKMWRTVGLFVLGKIVAAHQRALAELGRSDVTLGVGTWGFNMLESGDRFIPAGVGFYLLDYQVLRGASHLESPGGPQGVAKVAAHRPVYPIQWAQHDDGKYVGPPYPPLEHYDDLLSESKCQTAGYGIIHWTTRPLDVFFIGLSDSTWASTKNQPVRTTCRRLAREMLGASHEQIFGEYLYQWLTGLPKIGRETRDYFIDHALTDIDSMRAGHVQRMALLDRIDPATLTADQRQRVAYFRGLERFIVNVYENESHYRRALALYHQADWPAARAELRRADVPAAIRQYARNARRLGISRGEQGLIVTLNLRWLPHYLALAQQLDAESWRINFGPTSHDPLAQSAGRFTFYAEPTGRLWQTLGEKETGASAFRLDGQQAVTTEPGDSPAIAEIAREGLVIDQPTSLPLLAMMRTTYDRSAQRSGRTFAARPYRLTVWLLRPCDQAATVCSLAVTCDGKPVARRQVTLKPTRKSRRAVQREEFAFTVKPGEIKLIVTPDQGAVRLCGMTGQVMSESSGHGR